MPDDEPFEPIPLLIVDDDESVLTAIANVLRLHYPHTELMTARSVAEALELTKARPVSGVITDLRLPDGDGLTIVRAVLERTPDARCILMTAYGTDGVVLEVERERCFAYVEKPFTAEQLLKSVAPLVNRTEDACALLEEIALADIIHLYLRAGRNAVLRVSTPEKAGLLTFQEGILRHAQYGAAEGVEALLNLLREKVVAIHSLRCEGISRESLTLSLFLFTNLIELSTDDERRSLLQQQIAGNTFTVVKPVEEPQAIISHAPAEVLRVRPLPAGGENEDHMEAKRLYGNEPRCPDREAIEEELALQPEPTAPPSVQNEFTEHRADGEKGRRIRELIARGIEDFRAHRLAEARSHWQLALQLDPRCEAAKRNLAIHKALFQSLTERGRQGG